jgi:hypothetical protein
MIAIEEELAGTVGVDVDQAGRDDGALGEVQVAGAVGREDLGDAAALDSDAARDGRAVTEGEGSGT